MNVEYSEENETIYILFWNLKSHGNRIGMPNKRNETFDIQI